MKEGQGETVEAKSCNATLVVCPSSLAPARVMVALTSAKIGFIFSKAASGPPTRIVSLPGPSLLIQKWAVGRRMTVRDFGREGEQAGVSAEPGHQLYADRK